MCKSINNKKMNPNVCLDVSMSMNICVSYSRIMSMGISKCELGESMSRIMSVRVYIGTS